MHKNKITDVVFELPRFSGGRQMSPRRAAEPGSALEFLRGSWHYALVTRAHAFLLLQEIAICQFHGAVPHFT